MGIYVDRLKKIRAAIDEILDTGQSVSYSGSGSSRTLTSADLKELRDFEAATIPLAEQETADKCKTGRSRVSYVVPI